MQSIGKCIYSKHILPCTVVSTLFGAALACRAHLTQMLNMLSAQYAVIHVPSLHTEVSHLIYSVQNMYTRAPLLQSKGCSQDCSKPSICNCAYQAALSLFVQVDQEHDGVARHKTTEEGQDQSGFQSHLGVCIWHGQHNLPNLQQRCTDWCHAKQSAYIG